jgi:hypothetical protein
MMNETNEGVNTANEMIRGDDGQEKITKRFSGELDESNEDSNGNAAVKPGAFAVVPERILSGTRDAWSLALTSVDEMSSPPELQGDSQTNDSERSLSVNAPDEKQDAREARRSNRKARITNRVSAEVDGLNGNEPEKPGAFTVVPDGSLSVKALDGKQDAKEGKRSVWKEGNSTTKRVSGEPDESKEGSNGNEAETPGAVGVVGFNRDKSDSSSEDNSLDLVVAAEISPDNGDLEAQFDEKLNRQAGQIKKQLMDDLLLHVTAAEVVEEAKPPGPRRCVWILLCLLIVGVVVGVVVALGGKDGNPPTMAPTATVIKTPDPTASPTILATSPKFTQLLNLIGAVTSDIQLLQDRTTLQYAALDWLANLDAWEVDVDSVPPHVFVERYVLALLFFSTNGLSWRKGLNFLKPTSVCKWPGVTCDGLNGTDYVWRLEMGTYGLQRGA